MKTSIIKRILLASSSAVLLATSLQSATITWGPARQITNSPTDVSTLGALHAALGGVRTGGLPFVVNGVSFANARILGGTTGSLTDGNLRDDFIGGRIPTALEDNYEILLQYPTRLTSGTSIVTMSGLTSGRKYAVQVWASDNTGATVNGEAIILDSVTSGQRALSKETTEGGAGQYVFGTFIADAETQIFTARAYSNMLTTPTAAANTILNALQVRDITDVTIPVSAGLSTVAASPSGVPADGTTTSTITVTLIDALGSAVPGKDVTLAGSPGIAVINPAGAVTTNASGQATFTVSSATGGTVVFTATNTTDSQVITQTASVTFQTSASASLSTVTASPSNVPADGIVPSTITVTINDSNGMPMLGKSVTLAQTLGSGAIITPATAQTTNASGQVVFTVQSSTPGAAQFTATNVTDSMVVAQKGSVSFVDPSTPRRFNINFVQFTPTQANFEDSATLTGPAGGSGETWNQYRAVSGSNLLAADGTATSAAVTTNFTECRSRSTGGLVLLKHGLTDFNKSLTRTVTISGLPPGAYYNVWLASTVNIGGTESAKGTFSTSNPTSTVGPQPIDQTVTANISTWQQGNNFALLEDVVVDGSGRIVISAASAVDHRLPLNGIQLVPVGNALITSFGIPGYPAVIDQDAKTISLTVPFSTNLATLAPTFTLSSGTCNQTSGAPPSPTFAVQNPATYTVTDGDTVNHYTVMVNPAPASTACAMLTCDFGSLGQALIDEASGTVLLTVPPSQSVTALAPTFTHSPNATINPASGSTQNFTNPVVYRVTAENGVNFKDYTVSVQSYQTWAHSGSLFIDTTPTGANVTGSVSNFPLLVRFNSANFNFAQAQPDGRDIRFTNASGSPLFHQIDEWDSVNQRASVWVKIPTITGNSTQEILMYWGKSGVPSTSNGTSVFNSSNGYASVIHLGDTLADAVGTTTPANLSSTPINGLIGRARNFALGQGVTCGGGISGLPTGSGPFSTGFWVRTAKFPGVAVAWGTHEPAQKKVIISAASPPSIKVECWFGGADIAGTADSVPRSEWTYVVHTFQTTGTRLYVNGALNASNNGGTMQLLTTGRLDIGGWQPDGGFNYVGDIDEVRISNVVRPADWVKLEYENQKPMQTLVGGIVPGGSDFSVSPTSLTMNEASTTTLTAQAGGARKTYWIYKKNGQETVLATDQLTFPFTAGRVTANDSAVIQFKAVFSSGTQTIDVPLTVLEAVQDPVFTLLPSSNPWDGRQAMTVTANISNLTAMQAAGFGTVNYNWSVSGVAVIKQANNGTLTLTRSQGSGPMTVTLTADNGGTPVTNSIVINVQEPASDPWVERTPGATEKPVNGQFFARNPFTGLGTVFYNGTQSGSPDSVYLKVYQTPSGGSETLDATHRQTLGTGGTYAFSAPIAAGLFTYRVVYGTTNSGGTDTDVATVTDLVCGDAYLIEGQSNAVAGQTTDLTTDPFVRTFGTNNQWGLAVRAGNELRIGSWGMPLALHLKSTYNMPICIINAAVGGTRIDQHMPNPVNRALPLAPGAFGGSIYADLYNRVNGAKLSHGIRGVFWHQGESNSGADSPTGDWDYKSYQQYFIDLSAEWKQDMPNIQRYIIFQMQPKPCGMGPKGDQLREVQRTLPRLFSNMSILSTIGVDGSLGYDGCHYSIAGYQVIADMVAPVARRDFHGETPANAVTASNLKRAYYTNATRNQISLEFDQPTSWSSFAAKHIYLDDVAASITSGSDSGNVITIQLAAASNSSTIDYVQDQKPTWDGNKGNLIYGVNGIAALTFADVAIAPAPPAGLSAIGGTGQVALSWSATTGATSYKVKRATTSGGPYTTIATTVAPSFTDTSVVSGTPYFYVVSAVTTIGSSSSSEGLDSNQATATPLGGYGAWAANPAQGLTAGVNDGPFLDPESDGIANIMEFILGGAPMVSSTSVLPQLKNNGGQWVFEYDRNRDSLPPATTQVVQYSSDMKNWSDIIVPATSAGNVIVTPGPSFDRVSVTIPAAGSGTFARLKAY